MAKSRILWICNIMLPEIAKELSLPYSNREGWLSGVFEKVQKEELPFELGICFPVGAASKKEILEKVCQKGITIGNIRCYGFEEDLNHPEHYDPRLENRFTEIYQLFMPDMLHVFGTEFPHALAAVKSYGKPEQTLVGIQGICSEIAKVYMAGIPQKIQKQVTFRDWIRKDSLKDQQRKFEQRGEHERETIQKVKYVTGRTAFDRMETALMNENTVYYKMNETMRVPFYSGEWKLEQCERHHLFLGQGDYPLKGFHFLLQALPEILKKYPDTMLYVAGNSIIEHRTWKQKLKLPAYGKYLLALIKKNYLQDHIVMLGNLTAEEMKKQYLKTHVFICASILENSPNTLAEAMLLGVPVVAAKTGGIPDMLTDGQEGLLFEKGNPDQMAKAILRLFDETGDGNTFAEKLSAAARKRAEIAHDQTLNYERLLEIYSLLCCETKERV